MHLSDYINRPMNPAPGNLEVLLGNIRRRTNRGFAGYFLLQWVALCVCAFWFAPLPDSFAVATWHPFVAVALLWSPVVIFPVVWLARNVADHPATGYAVAVTQMIVCGFFIHVSSGRIETHFHVFVSLALLSLYLNTRLLFLAGAVIAFNHLVRGVLFPQTLWGPYTSNAETGDSLRWIEHVAWIGFAQFLAVIAVRERLGDLRQATDAQAALVAANTTLQEQTDALRQCETLLRELSENTPHIAALLSVDTGQAVYQSPSYRRLWQTEAQNEPWKNAVVPEHRDWVRSLWHGAINGASGVAEVRLAMPVAGVQWLRLEVFPVRDMATGQVYRVAVSGEDITDRQKRESEQTQAYERERRIASTLQGMVLEQPATTSEGIRVETFYRPALADEASVCGDFFDTVLLHDGRVALVVGDVSGKGLDAARHMTEAKYALRAYLRGTLNASPGVVLAQLNNYLCDAGMASLRRNAAERFVALSLAVIEPKTGVMVVACAGSEPPLLVQSDGVLSLETAGGLPLGVLPDAIYAEELRTLAPGETLVMVTDGITEARSNRRELLGADGWMRLVQTHLSGTTELRTAADNALTAVFTYANGQLTDDACCVWARKE